MQYNFSVLKVVQELPVHRTLLSAHFVKASKSKKSIHLLTHFKDTPTIQILLDETSPEVTFLQQSFFPSSKSLLHTVVQINTHLKLLAKGI